ncbi:MAG: glutamine-hydrolyzing GMP synthase [Gemmatimonadetes bacterium]|nr:glutamine-hydrolyzing GMP synthase [Gemmatimonadota bacterium]|tara:strand:+ start:2723 stop:4546 length:1824 start_codon:yes stop_codon:yes gene_type:complete
MKIHDTIAIIDFGGQYAHLIATKVRRQGVFAEILQPEDPIEAFRGYKGIIISGSPSLASHGEDADYNKDIYDLDIPILGFCFGHQEIAQHYGGKVIHGGREWGYSELQTQQSHPLFSGLSSRETVWMSHFDSVAEIGPDFQEIGVTLTPDGEAEHRYAAIASDTLQRYGFQFHPEVDSTENGHKMIANFLYEICGCTSSWSMDGFIEQKEADIRKQVAGKSVFLLASGGVDSTVAAVLIGRAIGPDRLHLLHVDNGLMRKQESSNVLKLFEKLGLGTNLHFVDASERFLSALSGIVDPEAKRRIIGDTFIEVFEDQAEKIGIEEHLLGQGTIYPDTIESGGTKRADTIKTHHNRVPAIEKMIGQGKVIEPLVELYKTEVRELGELLGIPREALDRHPFPGPGLGVRLLCSSGDASTIDLPSIQTSVSEISTQLGVSGMVLPIRSVGVKADLRAYEYPVLVSGYLPWDSLIKVVSSLTAEVENINRCIWNLSDEIPEVARPLSTTATRKRLDILREADFIVMEILKSHDLYHEIWQCPTVLLPIELDGRTGEMVIVRPIMSARGMTAVPVNLSKDVLVELRTRILALSGVSSLALDITSKPPATIEWE